MHTLIAIAATWTTSATLIAFALALAGCGGSTPTADGIAQPRQPTAAELAREAETEAARAALIEAQRKAAETARANQPTATPRPAPTAPPPPPTAPTRTLPESVVIRLREKLHDQHRSADSHAGRADRAIIELRRLLSKHGLAAIQPPDLRDHLRAGRVAADVSFYAGQLGTRYASDQARLWIDQAELDRLRTSGRESVWIARRFADRGSAALAAVQHRLEGGRAPDPRLTTTAAPPRTGSATFAGRWVAAFATGKPGTGTAAGSGPATIAVDFSAGTVRADLAGFGTFSGRLDGSTLAATLEPGHPVYGKGGTLDGALYGPHGRTAAGRFQAGSIGGRQTARGGFDTTSQPQGRDR